MTANLQGIVQRLGLETSSILIWELGNSSGMRPYLGKGRPCV
jgi:hypothetical protein